MIVARRIQSPVRPRPDEAVHAPPVKIQLRSAAIVPSSSAPVEPVEPAIVVVRG